MIFVFFLLLSVVTSISAMEIEYKGKSYYIETGAELAEDRADQQPPKWGKWTLQETHFVANETNEATKEPIYTHVVTIWEHETGARSFTLNSAEPSNFERTRGFDELNKRCSERKGPNVYRGSGFAAYCESLADTLMRNPQFCANKIGTSTEQLIQTYAQFIHNIQAYKQWQEAEVARGTKVTDFLIQRKLFEVRKTGEKFRWAPKSTMPNPFLATHVFNAYRGSLKSVPQN